MLNGPAQSIHGLGYAFVLVVNGGACDEEVGSRLHGLAYGSLVDASIYLYIAVQVSMGDYLAHASDFGEHFGDEILAPEARVDGHDEHHVEQGEDVFEHKDRG